MRPFVVVTGVAGSGKSTVGRALADRLGCPFFEGDDFHPEANVVKMSSGIPLDDDDRAPWLDALHDLIRSEAQRGRPGVLACSALKQAYRDRLRSASTDVVFVYLRGDASLIRRRMLGRTDHFMREDLLASQYAVLEEPSGDQAIRVDARQDVSTIVDQVRARL